jgi:hypothetical protein
MNFKKCCLVAILVITSNFVIYAQNARFSQIGTIATQLNPSLTGRFDGKARMSNLFGWYTSDNPKNGYAETQHQAISFDMKFGKYRTSGDDATAKKNSTSPSNKEAAKDESLKSKKQNGYWGIGMNYYHYSAPKSPIEASFISFSVARHFYNKSNKFYGFGLQVNNASGKLDRTKGTQYDREISGGGFPYRDTPFLNVIQNKKTYTDVNIGAYYGMNTEPVLFEMGVSLSHLFYPVFDLYNDKDKSKLRHRVSAYSNLRLKLNNKWGLVQKNVYWKEGLYYRSTNDYTNIAVDKKNEWDAPFVSFWTGVEFYKINPKSDINLNFGLNSRNFRTLMPCFNLNIGKYVDLRYSYEMPINSKIYRAYSAQRNEIGLVLSYGRNTTRGTNFYKKINFW